jgi:putative endonuclease
MGHMACHAANIQDHIWMKNYYVNILAAKRNGTLYIGVTNDLVRRIYEHKHEITGGFTKIHNVKMLVWFSETPDIAEAIRQEKRMKNGLAPGKSTLSRRKFLNGGIYLQS